MRTAAQQRAAEERSRLGGLAAAAEGRREQLFKDRLAFLAGVPNLFRSRPAGDPLLDGDDALDEVIDCFGMARYERRSITADENLRGVPLWSRGKRGHQKTARLRAALDRDALRTVRRLGGDWEDVFAFLVAVDERVREERASRRGVPCRAPRGRSPACRSA